MMRTLKLILVGLLFTLPYSGYAQNALYGDVNGDGEVNIADVNAVVSVILGESQMDNSIVGTWISEYCVDSYGRYDIVERDVVSFVFNEDNTGRFTYSSPSCSSSISAIVRPLLDPENSSTSMICLPLLIR